MRCEQAEEWMQRWLDGELAPEEEQALRRHLRTCPACADQWADVQVLGRQLDGLPRVTPPESLVNRMEAEWDRERIYLSRRRRRRWTGGAVGLAAAILLTWWVGTGYNDTESTVDTQRLQQPSQMSPTTPDDGAGVSNQSDTKPPPLPSPDGAWVARVEGEQVTITDADGKEDFRSQPWKEGAQVRLVWVEEGILYLHLIWENREEERWIDVIEKRESDQPLSSQKGRD